MPAGDRAGGSPGDLHERRRHCARAAHFAQWRRGRLARAGTRAGRTRGGRPPAHRSRVGRGRLSGGARPAARRGRSKASAPSAPTRPFSSTTRGRSGAHWPSRGTSSTSTRSPSRSRPRRSCCSRRFGAAARRTSCTPPRTSTSAFPCPSGGCSVASSLGAQGVSVCNTGAGELVRRRGFPGVPDLIPLGVDRSPSTEPVEAERPAGRVVGYAGRLADHKGVDVLLEAVARMASATLVVAGSGPSERALRRRAERPDLARRVTFTGSLTGPELAYFYRSVDVLAVPSRTTPTWVEQFGRVAVEAMAQGTPVVATTSGALPDVVGGAGLLVPPDDAPALRQALTELLDDPALRAHCREAGADGPASATGPPSPTATYACTGGPRIRPSLTGAAARSRSSWSPTALPSTCGAPWRRSTGCLSPWSTTPRPRRSRASARASGSGTSIPARTSASARASTSPWATA